MDRNAPRPLAAIACGGTGGHLFPGVAVAEELKKRGADVLLLISSKDVDQQAVQAATGVATLALPAVALTHGQRFAFFRGAWRSYRLAKRAFLQRPPRLVLGMGGFTCAPPILAGRETSAATFLHDSNTVPGRANRWIARLVDAAFVAFPDAARYLRCRRIECAGTPVRPQFQPTDAAAAREKLGLDPQRPTLLIMGGSQGAVGVNNLALDALPALLAAVPSLQFFHCAGSLDFARVRDSYIRAGANAVVHPFFAAMETALGAATIAVSRSGGSSLAELAAVRVPAVLIPYPSAADDHQLHNAEEFARTGAALLLEQRGASSRQLAEMLLPLLTDPARRAAMSDALAGWHTPDAAAVIAEKMLSFEKSTVPPVAA